MKACGGSHPTWTPQEGNELSGTRLGVTANEQARELQGLQTLRRGGRPQLPIVSRGIRTTLEGEDLKTALQTKSPLVEYARNVL